MKTYILLKNEQVVQKLDGAALLVADPPHATSTTTHPLSDPMVNVVLVIIVNLVWRT